MIKKLLYQFVYTYHCDVPRFIKDKKKSQLNKYRKIRKFKKKYPNQYYKYSKAPVDEKKVVFIEYRLSYLPNSFQLIYNKLVNEYDYKIHVHLLKMNNAPKEKTEELIMNMLRDIATAKYVFISEGSNILSSFKMRPETKMIQLWHGCGAFKRFGYSTADLIFGDTRKDMELFPSHKNYSLVTISSPEVKWAYEDAMNLKGKSDTIIDTGISRTDIFYDKQFIQAAYDKLYRLMPSAKGKKVILYSPTFRGRTATAVTPNLLNVEMFYEELKDDFVLITKHHPIVKQLPKIPNCYSEFACDMTRIMTIEELLCVSDICISDYSSLVFEYSLFEKPMIFFAYDIEEYYEWRGFYYPYDEFAPGPIVTTNKEMIEQIKHIDDFDLSKVRAFRNKFMQSCDGHATERILQLAMGDELKKNARTDDSGFRYQLAKNQDVQYDLRTIENETEELLSLKKRVDKIYHNATNKWKENRVLFLSQGSKISEVQKEVRNTLISDGTFECHICNLDKQGADYQKNCHEAAVELAAAKYIIVSEDIDLLNMIKLQDKSKVILIWNEAAPLDRIGYNTLQVMSGMRDEYMKIAPSFNNCDYVVTSSEFYSKIYRSAFNLAEDAKMLEIGACQLDMLLDDKYRQKARRKLNEIIPAAKNKKVILYHPESEHPTSYDEDKLIQLQRIYEEFSDEYVIIYYYDKQNLKIPTIDSYYIDFVVDMSDKIQRYRLDERGNQVLTHTFDPLTKMELLSIADLYLGSISEMAFEFAIRELPIMYYADNAELYFGEKETYFECSEDLPGSIVKDTKDLVNAIYNLDQFDYSLVRKFKAKYLTFCDGDATKRLLQTMKENK
ncbi:putative polyribitolphosphotransferase [Lachnospiraceae bacterium KM106-2]|nr:putative polyribitolphosphotransferase [Lachnospiraceae bacterium KM106-2]